MPAMGSLIRQFRARSEDGHDHVICEYAPDDAPAGHLQDPHATVRRKLTTFETDDGLAVSPVGGEEDAFLIVTLNRKVYRIAD